MAQQLTSIFFNVDSGALSNSAGLSKSGQFVKPIIYLKQKDLILSVDFIRADGTAVDDLFLANDTWGFAADDDFDTGSTLMMQSGDSEFNIALDRPDLSITNGRISLRLDADTTELTTALAATAEIEIKGEIQCFNFGETNPKAVFRIGLTVRNLVDNAGAGPAPAPVGSFYTKAEADALLGGKEELQTITTVGIDMKVLATTNLFTIGTGRKSIPKAVYVNTTAITGASGMPKIKVVTDGGAELFPATKMDASGEGVVGGLMRLELTHDKMLAAGEIVQLEVTDAGTSTTHTVSAFYNGLDVSA